MREKNCQPRQICLVNLSALPEPYLIVFSLSATKKFTCQIKKYFTCHDKINLSENIFCLIKYYVANFYMSFSYLLVKFIIF